MNLTFCNPRTAWIAVAVAGVLAGCAGVPSYMPTGDSVQGSAPTLQTLVPDANAGGTCTAPVQKVPGTYIEMVAFGNVAAGTFTSQTGLWFQSSYKPGPKPAPSSVPSAKPGPRDYFYIGTYVLKKSKQTGCAVLLATQNGKPFKGSKQNAFGVGAPLVKAKTLKITPLESGNLSMTITGLSASGGRGSATLTTSTGAAYDTATITLTGRYTSP
jgi:hypothetical protein